MATILVVEDSRTQAEVLRSDLIEAGYYVVVTNDGDEALQRLSQEGIDLVLSDVVMPRTNGYDLCREIKATHRDLPVVLLTSLTDPLDVINGLLAGADNFLRKPYDRDQLLGRLRTILDNRDMRQTTGRASMGLELFFLGQRFTITSERQQLLDLLISTFEDLVRTNEELRAGEQHLAQAHAAAAEQYRVTELERRRLQAVLSALPVGMVIVDERGDVADVNEAMLDLTRRERTEVVGRQIDRLYRLVDHNGDSLLERERPLRRALEQGHSFECGSGFDVFVERADGSRAAAVAKAAPIRDDRDAISGAVGLLQEIGSLASHSPLMGLPTHALLVDRVREASARSAAQKRLSAVLVVVVDRMERFRDAGREAYEDVIVETAARLKALVDHRQVNALARDASLAYLDDGEFALVLSGLRQEVDAVRVAEFVVAEAGGPAFAGQAEVTLEFSVGISVAREPATDPAHLVSASVAAAREATRAGGHRARVAETSMQDQLAGRLQVEAELRRAISSGDLEVHYQPQLELRTSAVVGVEALVRWRHPERGLVPPGDFIPLAEDSGLILPLGLFVLREACSRTAAWRQQLAGGEHLVVSVNLAAQQLNDDEIADEIAQILGTTGLDPGALVLEITETAVMTDAERVGERLQKLKALGMRLAIDDFGTGYSSLLQLHRFPIDTLKVDRGFVKDMTSESRSLSIVDASIRLGHALDLEVIAEGVETEEQAAALRDVGCEVGQGFLWSPALPPAEFERWWGASQRVGR